MLQGAGHRLAHQCVDQPARRLAPTLLTDSELAAGLEAWMTFEDPLPEWDFSDLHDHAHTY